MEQELRPLTLGETLDRTFQLYRARFALFLGIAALATLIETLWSLIQLLGQHGMTSAHVPATTIQAITQGMSIFVWIINFASAALFAAASNRAIMDIYEDRAVGIPSSYRQILPHWLRYAWLNVLVFLIAWGLIVIVSAAGAVSIIFAAKAQTRTGANAAAGVFGIVGLIVVIAFPLCVWLTLRYSLALQASVSEGLGVLASLKRSVFLSKDNRWRIFTLLLLVAVAQTFLLIGLMVPVYGLIAKNPAHVPTGATIYILLVSFISSTLIKPVFGIGLTLFYLDTRIRKEGYDIEWQLQHAAPQDHSGDPVPATLHPPADPYFPLPNP